MDEILSKAKLPKGGFCVFLRVRHSITIWIVIFGLYALFGHTYEELAYSVVPGWQTSVFQTSIYYPWDALKLVPEVFFLVTIIGYVVLKKFEIQVKPAFFFVHLFLNLPALLRWWYPSFQLRDSYLENVNFMVWINKAGVAMMVLGLVIFAVNFIYALVRLRSQKRAQTGADLQAS